jgi:hypothetical protein
MTRLSLRTRAGGPGGGLGRRAGPRRGLYAQAMARHELLWAEDHDAICEACARARFHSDHTSSAAADTVRLRESLGDEAALGQAVACLSVQQRPGPQAAALARRCGPQGCWIAAVTARGVCPRCSTSLWS